ncbi:hypothetical protein B0T10DRAFT_496480 [Thelonectria olida]|uniref:Magnesium transporter n=1 Tax=Thelonectria olida TaxID=1576542 RepID=A0A9P8VUY2_9HYPO|nr:hypothetical protein B0T10DRAFT_496480 [Thelonectria olida]
MLLGRFNPHSANRLARMAYPTSRFLSAHHLPHSPSGVLSLAQCAPRHKTRRNVSLDILRASHTASKPDVNNQKAADHLYSLSIGLFPAPVNGNTDVHYTLYRPNGTAPLADKLTKHDIAKTYGLTPRDLRTFDLPSGGFPHILIREDTMLIHMFSLRLLVQADRVLLLSLEDTIEEQQDITSRVFQHKLETTMRGVHGVSAFVNLPYELRVLEAALSSVTSTLEAEYILTRQQVSESLDSLDKDENIIHSELRSMLDLMRNLARIEDHARHVRTAIQEVLNEDQDMADMHLTDKRAGKRHATQDHQDVEYLLEAYYKASDAVVQKAASLGRYTKQTEETIHSILNVRRNQILVLETKIEIIILGLAAATLLAGLYGMNVVNYFEESEYAFGILSSICVVGTALIGRYGMRQLRYIQKMQPKKLQTRHRSE